VPGPAGDPSPASHARAMRKIVLLPVFNEGPSLPSVLEGLVLSADEIIAIDDGSRDDSADILRTWAATNRRVTLVSLPRNLGKSEALAQGFRRITDMLDAGSVDPDDAVITMDADGQIPPEIIDRACADLAARRLDMLIGARDFRLYPSIKRLGNAFFTRLASVLVGFPFQDTLCGLRVLRAGSLVRIMPWYRARRFFCEQEISMIGVRMGLAVANDFLVPTAFYRSNSTWPDAIQIAIDSLRTWWSLRKLPGRREEAL
jgi:glycosyltransferase involved in cell wall biosynthesis